MQGFFKQCQPEKLLRPHVLRMMPFSMTFLYLFLGDITSYPPKKKKKTYPTSALANFEDYEKLLAQELS